MSPTPTSPSPALPVPGLPAEWQPTTTEPHCNHDPVAVHRGVCECGHRLPPAGKPRRRRSKAATPTPSGPTPGERVLARLMALGDAEPLSPDYQRAIADVLRVLMDCAPECHQEGHR